MHEFTVTTDIDARRWAVWNLIRSAETAVLLDAHTVSAHSVPETPRGLGERQVFVSHIRDREYVNTIEIVGFRSGELAVTRGIEGSGTGSDTEYRLRDIAGGTRLEITRRFTIPARLAAQRRAIIQYEREVIVNYSERVKAYSEAGYDPLR